MIMIMMMMMMMMMIIIIVVVVVVIIIIIIMQGVSQERIYSENCICCHTETKVSRQTSVSLSENTDTRPTSPSEHPLTAAGLAGPGRSHGPAVVSVVELHWGERASNPGSWPSCRVSG